MKTIKMILFFLLFTLSTGVLYAGQPLQVVTTLPDFKNLAEIIGGNKVNVISLSSGRQDPHHYEIKPSDILKLKNADLLIINGLELDAWVNLLILNSRNPKIQKDQIGFLDASHDLNVLDVPTVKVDRSQGDVHPAGNPHYNLSPSRIRQVVLAITAKLSALDPQHAAYYAQNEKLYLQKFDQALITWKAKLKKVSDKPLVSFHNSWSYFFEEFGLRSGGYMEPYAGISPTSQHLEKLISRMKTENTQIILKETYYSRQVPEFLAARSQAQIIELPTYVGALPETSDYLSLMNYLVERISQHD